MTVGQVDLAVGRQWRCLAGCRAGRRASGVLRLQLRQFGDRIEPTPGATATIDRPARSYNCRASRARCAMTGLALGIGHRAVADRFARHGSIPKVSEAPWSSVFPIDGYAASGSAPAPRHEFVNASLRPSATSQSAPNSFHNVENFARCFTDHAARRFNERYRRLDQRTRISAV